MNTHISGERIKGTTGLKRLRTVSVMCQKIVQKWHAVKRTSVWLHVASCMKRTIFANVIVLKSETDWIMESIQNNWALIHLEVKSNNKSVGAYGLIFNNPENGMGELNSNSSWDSLLSFRSRREDNPRRKWIWWPEFKSFPVLFTIRLALVPLGKAWIHPFFSHRWTNCALQPWLGNQSRRRKNLNSNQF